MVEFAINRPAESADEETRREGLTPFAAPSMIRPAPTPRFDLETLRRLVADETAKEASRRGESVSPHDPAVRASVCDLLLRQADRAHQGGDATVFTELTTLEDEPSNPPWVAQDAAA